MYELYWGCLIFGIIYTSVTVIFGDILGDMFDGVLEGMFEAPALDHLDFLQPAVLVGGLTIFGGSGIMLTQFTPFSTAQVISISAVVSVFLSVLLYFGYVKPMKNTENSTGFSTRELSGKIGIVTVPVPARGYGEVMVRIGAGNTSQIAASCDGEELPAGTRVVVGEVRDGILYVFKYEED